MNRKTCGVSCLSRFARSCICTRAKWMDENVTPLAPLRRLLLLQFPMYLRILWVLLDRLFESINTHSSNSLNLTGIKISEDILGSESGAKQWPQWPATTHFFPRWVSDALFVKIQASAGRESMEALCPFRVTSRQAPSRSGGPL